MATSPNTTKTFVSDGEFSSVFGQTHEAVIEDRSEIVARPSRQRSALTNDPLFVRGVDGRSATARRYRDLCQSLADDLGGASSLSAPVQALVRQSAAVMVQCEEMQSRLIADQEVDLEQLTRLSNVLTRLHKRLGLKRPAPKPTKSLLVALAEGAR